jgi:hypothetical protein
MPAALKRSAEIGFAKKEWLPGSKTENSCADEKLTLFCVAGFFLRNAKKITNIFCRPRHWLPSASGQPGAASGCTHENGRVRKDRIYIPL